MRRILRRAIALVLIGILGVVLAFFWSAAAVIIVAFLALCGLVWSILYFLHLASLAGDVLTSRWRE